MDSCGTYIVTGANRGIGRAITELLAQQGRAVIMACCEEAKAVRNEIVGRTGNRLIKVWHLDLASLKLVRKFIERVRKSGIKIAALVNNAGMIAHSFKMAECGVESSMAVNYVGTAALTLGMLPLMGEGSTIINTLSLSTDYVRPTRKIFIPRSSDFVMLREYAYSKLALLYFTTKLAADNPNLRIVATDPGAVNTGIIRFNRWYDPFVDALYRPFARKPHTAAKITMRALADTRTNTLYKGRRGAQPLPDLADSAYSKWLWEETDKLINGSV